MTIFSGKSSLVLNSGNDHDFISIHLQSDSFFETSVLLITFVMLGRLLENLAKAKTADAITKLLSLQPATAVLLEVDEHTGEVMAEQEIDTNLIQKGDILKVRLLRSLPPPAKNIFFSDFFLPASGAGLTPSNLLIAAERLCQGSKFPSTGKCYPDRPPLTSPCSPARRCLSKRNLGIK